ncbi:MAG TPA: periplasmic nitrate reductase, NapE protein [Rhodanobacteraceae bacterium]|jgi:nitrate reductase NapE|nr:periplasmic nitrate reductase, NapE protein [Rhodanobacteraceae bacterium]
MNPEVRVATRRTEFRLFLFLTVVFIPLLAVATVVTYGFLVWMWQLVMGPPGV